jgi:predicted nucleotidyltransferase
MKIEKELNMITSIILDNIDAKYIYLFGSYAYGQPREDSDIDIYIVLPNKYSNFTEIYTKIVTELSIKNIFFVDIILTTEIIFDTRKTKYIFENTIYNKGKIIYAS